jgi:hypothetical protein
MAKNDLQGTLDLLILKTLSQMVSLHGYGIVLHIQRVSDASPHGAEWMDQLRVGADRNKPESEILQTHLSGA